MFKFLNIIGGLPLSKGQCNKINKGELTFLQHHCPAVILCDEVQFGRCFAPYFEYWTRWVCGINTIKIPGINTISHGFNPLSPGFNPISPGFGQISHGFNPISHGFNLISPGFNPISHGFNPISHWFNPISPGFNPQ